MWLEKPSFEIHMVLCKYWYNNKQSIWNEKCLRIAFWSSQPLYWKWILLHAPSQTQLPLFDSLFDSQFILFATIQNAMLLMAFQRLYCVIKALVMYVLGMFFRRQFPFPFRLHSVAQQFKEVCHTTEWDCFECWMLAFNW